MRKKYRDQYLKYREPFSKALYRYLALRKITQQQLADELFITLACLRKWLEKQSFPRTALFPRLQHIMTIKTIPTIPTISITKVARKTK